MHAHRPQEEFHRIVQQSGGRDAQELFSFRQPRNGLDTQARKNASQVLNLTPRQHGIMYALAG